MTQLDFTVLNLIQHLRCPPLDTVMIILTFLGDYAIPWTIAALFLLLKKGERRRGLTIALAMIIGIITGSVILKHVFLRERPFNNPAGLLVLNDLILSPPVDRFSFPSGHSITSFAAATGIFMWNRKFGAAALALAGLIAFSRLYVYVHFPSDVLAGIVIGILCAVAADRFTAFLENKIIKKGS